MNFQAVDAETIWNLPDYTSAPREGGLPGVRERSSPFLNASSTGKQVVDQQEECDDKEEMDQASAKSNNEAQQPENDHNNENGPNE